MTFDDSLGLVKADPQSGTLGRLKRSKEMLLDESGRHAASVVGDGHDDPWILVSRCNMDDTSFFVRLAYGILGVGQQISQDSLDLIAIQCYGWERG